MFVRKIIISLSLIILTGFVLILAGFVLVFILSSPPARVTRSWQTVTIAGIGTFRVPMQWNVEEEDGILYITDRSRIDSNYTIYIVGTSCRVETPLHTLFESVEEGDHIRSMGFGIGSSITVRLIEYTVNGVVQEHRVISFSRLKEGEWRNYRMFVWNREVVDSWHVEQIARTFRMNRVDFNHPNFGRLVQ